MSEQPKRVGIITIHHVPNYGAFLQAWSLAKAVKQLGHQVEIIDYRHPKAIQFYKKLRKNSRFGIIKSWAESRLIQYECNHLPLTKQCHSSSDLQEVANQYDVVICGSDQIWHTKSIRDFDPAYFLDFVKSDKVRRISYAPSCSGLDSFSPHDGEVKSLLDKFDALSGRDARTLELVKELGDYNIRRVVDPTLLVDHKELESNGRINKQEYLLIYGGIESWAFPAIRHVAKERGLKIIAIGNRCRAADKSDPFVLPNKWLAYFRDAKAVITSAFHGAMFAIINKRPLLAIPSVGKEAKISDALDTYGLSDRLVKKSADPDSLITAEKLYEPYDNNEIIQPLIDQSREYLRQAIDG